MNIELLSTFQQNYPEEFDGILDCTSMAVCCAFNKIGSLLAVGCSDGRLIVWDFLTRGIAKIIAADWAPICCLSWSKKSDMIATSSTENFVCIWSTLTGTCLKRISFLHSPILKVQFHPRNSAFLLICPMKHPPVLINQNGEHQIVSMDDDSMDIVSTFDRKGAHIILGNNRGTIVVKKFPELSTVSSFRITTGTTTNVSLKHIEIPRRGPHCLINTSDRIIRVYNSEEMLSCGMNVDLEPKQKLQDLVNKSLWRKCCWSGDGEYICGASARSHSLYIWETVSGKIVKILQGTKGETLADVCWHPVRPIIVSISSGFVSIWSYSQVENWSAFAPDFRELEENVEYHERESEFDVNDEDRSLDGFNSQTSSKSQDALASNFHSTNGDEDEFEIDVVQEPRIEALVSSDDEDINDQLIFLPSAPEVEDPDVDELSLPVRQTSPSVRTPTIVAETIEVKLDIPPVREPHPYLMANRQVRTQPVHHTSPSDPQQNKRDVKERRKRPFQQSSSQTDQESNGIQTILHAKSIDAAIATVISTPKRTLLSQVSETKGQRARSARLEGKKSSNTTSVSVQNSAASAVQDDNTSNPRI